MFHPAHPYIPCQVTEEGIPRGCRIGLGERGQHCLRAERFTSGGAP
jgi:hypothetical protein